jgi:hypothetical protein
MKFNAAYLRGDQMPIFYFNVRDRGSITSDSAGVDLRDIDDARACALSFVRKILEWKIEHGETVMDQVFEISDRAGALLAVVPFQEAISPQTSTREMTTRGR